MQYVGRFVSSVYNTITPNINPATLSGAIDVIVVEREVEKEVDEEDGSGKKKKIKVTELASTPFHVRFGKMSVLRPAERKVTLHLNDSPEPLPFAMKVGEAGEAFFVLELNDEEARQGVPDELVTSPILSATTSPNIPADDVLKSSNSDSKIKQSTNDSHMELTEGHQPPRKLIAETYVEPLDLGASSTSSTTKPADLPKASSSKPAKAEEAEQDIIPTVKTNGQKDALHYMLDMDGYKMTEDGEEIAYEESSRLAKEVPISKRHGLPLANGGASAGPRSAQRRGSFGDVEGKSLNGSAAAETLQKRRGSFSVRMNGSSDDVMVRDGEASLESAAQSTTDTISGANPEIIQHTSKALGKEISGWSAPGSLPRTSTDPLLDTKSISKANGKAEEEKITPPRRAMTSVEAIGQQKTYAKTLRLTSDQLKSLDLKKGANTISFSVTSSYSGVAMCTARIFLWNSTHRIVVSDIDGTITKSDALGHLYTMIGRDWTHSGVAKLYTDVARNGYRIMYLTSRAIGQADSTRDYLRGINQGNFRLPDGPVIMSPDRLMASLHREVILRKPEVFKMACLRDIARLFGADQRGSGSAQTGLPQKKEKEVDSTASSNDKDPLSIASATSTNQNNQPTPFYAGFGNRITDALSYRSVNIPSSRIFTIDSNGEVKMELLELAGYKSSYIHMTDLVDQMFPPITAKSVEGNTGKPEFNDFNFWRSELGEFDLPPDDELIHTPVPSSPVSPALSARSIRSTKSLRSVRDDEFVAPSNGNAIANTHGRSNSNANDDVQSNTGSTSRLSRFGLGKLGLSRRGSNQTIAAPPSQQEKQRADTGSNVSQSGPPTIASSPSSSSLLIGTSPPSSPGSYGSGVTSWTAGWRRRAASPTAQNPSAAGNVQATSPLVGPVINAEPDDLDEDGEDDDDVSSFGGDEEEGDEDDEEDDNDEEEGQNGDQQGRRSGRKRDNRNDMGDDVMDDDDPLLATGEIQFEWRG
ncbi:LNS2-domain-containing protein [Meira miltonrushii]|uniref:LNS2-domain-containing protein n=1 Tax=Meira miltonrushii TaxID=1280837 RepID=A0A316VMK4_9BASI|nr:LNS2-domain-containing protein [Meira miltonrushii]PWN36795.1 LNS2-domain-containing protein [Meira miltonrushii]